MEPNNPTSPPRYSDHAVAFLDVIRFTDIIQDTLDDEALIERIAQIFHDVGASLIALKDSPTDLHASMFSDTIVISSPHPTDGHILGLTAAVSHLQCMMIRLHLLLRGSVAFGPHYESGSVMFGPCMIEAYEGEKAADWPRVILAPSVLRRLRIIPSPVGEAPYFLTTENDGLCYVDYLARGTIVSTVFRWTQQYLAPTPYPEANDSPFALIADHRQTILLHTSRAIGIPHLTKCHALADYHNRTVSRIKAMLAHTYTDTQRPCPDLDFLCRHAAGLIRLTTSNASDTQLDSFFARNLDDLRSMRNQLTDLQINLPTFFPTLYGLPPNE